ncbi:hypothetical protein EXIGLDRAFT_736782 [Exidia glandulosa HHB12029]|uniref:Carbohydrate kinase PfkB domain-containing protein n=1 Tax=Exidia glandulosa HHB12029 TaxID=1314781 RepID=A0A165PEL4_EXIGL|nr:hypothetical protein EXIGLDRAFT_736782 [Exidia glandulosa HHB12029]
MSSSRHGDGERSLLSLFSHCCTWVGDRLERSLTSPSPRRRFFRARHHMNNGAPRPVRVVASGTLFLVNTLAIDVFPAEGTTSRAKNVSRTRGGPAAIALSLLAQLSRVEYPRGIRSVDQRGRSGAPEVFEPAIEAFLIAALAGDPDGQVLIRELHDEGVSTKFSKVLDRPVPTSWVFQSDTTQTRTVVHHNSIPDISHVEFVELLGPLLIPENYNNLPVPTQPQSPPSPRPSFSSQKRDSPPPVVPELPSRGAGSAPFDIVFFEARSVPQTRSNMHALDGLARERGWRDKVAFCLEISRKDRQGVEVLIRSADVVFFSKAYAMSREFKAPRPFLLSMVAQAAPHALLVVNWGSAGAALLSVPTREYFQSSGWTEPELERQPPPPPPQRAARDRSQRRPAPRSRSRPAASSSTTAARFADERRELQSVRSGSQFWADGRGTPGTGVGTEHLGLRDWDLDPQGKRSEELWRRQMRQQDDIYDETSFDANADDDDDDNRTEDGRSPGFHPTSSWPEPQAQAPDESGAQNAFVAGMMYALTKRVLPRAPYSPVSDPEAWHPREGPWRLEECLKFATELAGRKSRRPAGSFEGLAHEMQRAGWFTA